MRRTAVGVGGVGGDDSFLVGGESELSSTSLELEVMNNITTEEIDRFMLETNWLSPTDTTPDIREVHDILEQYEDAEKMCEQSEWILFADAIKQECSAKYFADGWWAALPKWFKRKDGTETMNVQFYVEKAKDIMEKSGLEGWEFQLTNVPFVGRIHELRYFLSWFKLVP